MPRISVTQEDIEQGQPEGDRCPLALAISRKIERKVWVDIMDGQHASVHPISDASGAAAVGLPSVCKLFIEKFDNKKPVRPFAFTLSAEAIDKLTS